MKKFAGSIIGGIAGAFPLEFLRQAVKLLGHEAPGVDLVGEEAISAGINFEDHPAIPQYYAYIRLLKNYKTLTLWSLLFIS